MIAYLEGTLFKMEEDRILLLVQQVGYEVFLPAVVLQALEGREPGTSLALHIYYHQTERQPRPILIGFHTEKEKEFFQIFLTVEDIGPVKAAKALTLSVGEIARLIEAADVKGLSALKGVGKRTAQKIVATLGGKVERFLDSPVKKDPETVGCSAVYAKDLIPVVVHVMTDQLGYKTVEAEKLIHSALKRCPEINSPENLLEEVLRSNMPGGSHGR
ncbi:Holliday junction DNA helicase subunit RuvA [Desulfobotulus alkaliphilus]|uniref:Holliday junction branch migration complex subunit RuvA n=1 Tax=Desulfobotulus alkaliphilus TaxID=622671 RepID=A0A562RRN7_9BACT|nr:Holliday junction branch migration protein RuvA [Desulfobotulus alkaliphilus]TWI71779.1 Holliday junction DNA helicase subunit RuvA [Desulfobotulus alkaliphilus]